MDRAATDVPWESRCTRCGRLSIDRQDGGCLFGTGGICPDCGYYLSYADYPRDLDDCRHCGRPDENELCEECYRAGWRLCEECGALGNVGVYGPAEYLCADCEEDADRALSEETP